MPASDTVKVSDKVSNTACTRPFPVLASGRIADGCALAAMLAFGAAGVHHEARFLPTVEAPMHGPLKQLIVASDGNRHRPDG